VEHGGGEALSVESWIENGHLVAEIRHDGRGFNPPVKIGAPSQGAPRGYGLFIMHEVLDGVEFLEGGLGLRLVMRIET
jgi:Histidine kinase-like ATPase domain